MTHNNYNTEKRKFKHINFEQRKLIEQFLEDKMPKTQIAKIFHISRSTLYKEIERGTVVQRRSDLTEYKKYFAETGQEVYEQNRKNSRKPLKMAEAAEFIKYAEEEILTNKMSPDIICGRAKAKNLF